VQLSPPLRFRLHTDDHDKYGSDWYVYDESAIVRLPIGELKAIEAAIGMSVLVMMNRWREGYIDGTLAQLWVGRRVNGVAEDFATFEPLAFLAEWEPAGAADADPPESSSSSPRAAPKRSSGSSSRSSRSSRTSRPKG
jgi:hypothetical protein